MPPTQTTSLLTETSVLWLSILVGILGLISLAAVVLFGIYLYRGRLRRPAMPDDDFWMRLFDHAFHGPSRPMLRPLVDAYSEQLQRRNEFWTSYGQVIIATLIIIVLTILLLTRTISAEAGLPVLSGISGFAIAKSVSSGRSPSPEPEQRG
jgi:hypothetical protein